jgi:hypothetical protein
MKKEPISCIILDIPDDMPKFLVVFNLGPDDIVCSEICIKDFVKEINHLKYYQVCILEETQELETIQKLGINEEPLIGAVLYPTFLLHQTTIWI